MHSQNDSICDVHCTEKTYEENILCDEVLQKKQLTLHDLQNQTRAPYASSTNYYKYKNNEGVGMANQQKRVQQETAYNVIVQLQ